MSRANLVIALCGPPGGVNRAVSVEHSRAPGERMTAVANAARLDDPTPINYGVPGCPAMVRSGTGQWSHCGGTPVIAGTVGRGRRRYLVFVCATHRCKFDGPRRPMTDADRAELARRREQGRGAKAGHPFQRVQPIQ